MQLLLLLFAILLGSCTNSSIPSKVVVDFNGQTLPASFFAEELAFRLHDLDALSAKDPIALQKTKNKIVKNYNVQALSAQ